MNSYLVVCERAEDGGWGAFLPDIDGVVALGRTREEVEDGMHVALGAYLDWLKERGETAPAPSSCEVGFIAA
ncbi:MAG: type II toxin-antitoxin system HicB family antitoxin [Actinobacteria bacterium]|nr:type II toxin-antitoxin system HicB family antitoxin [Actinomycetota bacterium]